MEAKSISVEHRETGSKGRVHRVRKAGLTPGVVYGGDKSANPIKFNHKDLDRILNRSSKGMNTLIEMQYPDQTAETVIVRELQREPMTGALLHVDFYRVSLSERISAEVPLTWVGEAEGVKKGGLLQPGLRTVLVECLPDQIPDRLEVPVAQLEVGDKLTVADLNPPPGVEIQNEPDEVVVSILSARVEAEPATPTPAEEKPEATEPPTNEGDRLAAR